MERERAADLFLFGPSVAKERAPLVCEVIGVICAREQRIDPFVTFGGVLVLFKLLRLVRRRQSSRDVYDRPTKEGCVIAYLRRWHADGLQLLEDELVDDAPR